MRHYDPQMKGFSRILRSRMTDAEIRLWAHLRSRQLEGIRFYRQKPLAKFIVDFFAPSVGLVVELDGGQHFTEEGLLQDAQRDTVLREMGLHILRFDNFEVLKSTDAVLEQILEFIQEERQKKRLE